MWAEIVSGLDAPLGDTAATSCHRGEPACLEAVLAEMEARLERLGCAHTAPFAFTYLQMTRGVAEAADQFDNEALISVVDARFAQQYFDAFDNWVAGNLDQVPAPWQVAFATADRAESTAALDLILGMNAHISRDLAYVVAQVVAADPDLTEEPEDYRRVNEVIGLVKSPMLEAAADRFDPGLFLLDTQLPNADVPDPVTLINDWRSFSFDLGLRLARAESEEDRQAVIAEIERTATAAAGVLVAAESATGVRDLAGAVVGGDAADTEFLLGADRVAYCEQQRATR